MVENNENQAIEYKRLPFEQYFIDQSLGLYLNEEEKAAGAKPRFEVPYKEVKYKCRHGYDHNTYYAVVYDEERKVIQIYLKETSSKSQWRANFNFPDTYYDRFQFEGKDIQLKVARGWCDLYCAIKHNIRDEYKALFDKYGKREVEIIGWSLGSATAQLCAQDLFFNYGIKAHVFTYGSVKPFCGKDKDMREYISKCYAECYNFRDCNDIVGYLVPLPGYFAIRHYTVAQDKFNLFKLFKPNKYHTEYSKSKLYTEVK